MGATVGKSGGNFLDALPTQETLHVVMLGLDSAGKTTALYRLKFDQYLNTVPTIGFNCEKIQGTVGKAKGVQFLVWDVGGQEKLRPLWRSYTRCTDGILFVVDSVDVERMEEAKMELMRTAKCPDNQGVPVLILANKQDLPGARESKDLEKLLGLNELSSLYSTINSCSSSSNYSAAGNFVGSNIAYGNSSNHTHFFNSTSVILHNKPVVENEIALSTTSEKHEEGQFRLSFHQEKQTQKKHLLGVSMLSPPPALTTLTATCNGITATIPALSQNSRGWFIQPACAITGDGLQEGLDALYDMILKRRKMYKGHKKKR